MATIHEHVACELKELARTNGNSQLLAEVICGLEKEAVGTPVKWACWDAAEDYAYAAVRLDQAVELLRVLQSEGHRVVVIVAEDTLCGL